MPPLFQRSIVDGLLPVYDVPLIPTPTLVRSAAPLADIAPGGGPEATIVSIVALIVGIVLVLILRARRK